VTGPPRGAPGVGGELVYAIGDVHGCYELMRDLLAQLAADYAERAQRRRPILVFLGDYVDRGPQSAQVLDALVWLQRRSDLETHFLKGAHEQALLEFLDAPELGEPWLASGGAETLLSYGVEPPRPDAPAESYPAARDELLARMPAAHLRLLQRLEPMVVIGDHAFMHAGDRPGPSGKTIVHGEGWVSDQPQLASHRLGLDTGGYATGVLTAARIEDGEMEILQARHGAAWTPEEPALA
jgi:serine/threonine protein phosphatase 1